MSLRSKVENIWYHYKFHILISLFLLGTCLICLHSCVTKPEFDIQVYYVTGETAVYKEQMAWIENAVAAHCEDVNGDGKVTVAVTNLKVGKNTDPSERARYLNAVQAGEVMLLFGDQEGISYLYDLEWLQPLTDYSDRLDGNGYAWKVSGSSFAAETEGFDLFGDTQVYISLRTFEGSFASLFSRAEKNYEIACNTLRSIIETPAPSEE